MNNAQQVIPVSAADVAARVADETYRALVAEAQYPSLPHELTSEFLAGVDPQALSPEEKAALIQEYDADLRLTALLDKFVTALSSRQAKLLVKDQTLYDLIGIEDGLRSFADFRGQQSGKGARAAAQELEVAQTLVETPSAQRAVDAGEITIDHVEVLSKAVSRMSRRGDDKLTVTEEAELVEMGKGRTADDYAKEASRYLNGRNPLGHDASQSQIRRKRYLQVSYTPVGAHIKGFIDPVAAQTLRLALEAATAKPAKDDDRSYEQRSADALEAIASLALNTGDLKAGALVRPHLSFIMTEKTFQDATRELARREQFSVVQNPIAVVSPFASAGPSHQDPIAMEPAEFEDGTTIPLNELTRLVCDSQITRVVLSADGSPLNIGRTQRLYAKELRRAIIARDRSCRVKGCNMAARWSEIHHIQWWDKDNGETSIENGILCCKFHHSQIHERVLTVIHDSYGLPQIVLNNLDPAPRPPQAAPIVAAGLIKIVAAGPIKHSSPASEKEPEQHEPSLFDAQGTNVGTPKPASKSGKFEPARKLEGKSPFENKPIGLRGSLRRKLGTNQVPEPRLLTYGS